MLLDPELRYGPRARGRERSKGDPGAIARVPPKGITSLQGAIDTRSMSCPQESALIISYRPGRTGMFGSPDS